MLKQKVVNTGLSQKEGGGGGGVVVVNSPVPAPCEDISLYGPPNPPIPFLTSQSCPRIFINPKRWML